MKPIRNIFTGLFILVGFVLLLNLLHAQETETAIQVAPLSLTPTDLKALPSLSEKQVTALLSALDATPTIPADTLPRSGTYWSLANPAWPPLPGNFHSFPVWAMDGGNSYLLNDLDFDYNAEIQSTATRSGMRMMSFSGVPGFDDTDTNNGGDDTNSYFSTFFIDTNLLWLDITTVSNDWSYLNLHNGTNQVYAIWVTTNLLTAWQVETEVWPTNPAVQPFTLPTSGRDNLFLRAQDWTGVDSDGDGIPDWWIWKYFDDLSETATNLDSQGNTLWFDYQYGLDPNVISFTMRLGNQNFNTTNATGSFLVLGGVPSYEAVLVNEENFSNAVWQPYDGTVKMNLGSTDGVYQVWLGLKGRAEDSQPTWIGTKIILNRQVPQITLISPTNGVVAQPYLQLQGYASLPLAGVSYDLNGETNLSGLIIGHTLDTNTFSYTTDYFQCYDLLLNEGTNTISLHTIDPAGNTLTTNLTVVLDYATATNPMIKLTWPQNGLELCGDSFTLRGWTEDAAAAATATIIATNGCTNTVAGIVSRDGNLWVQGLPLNSGTNFVTLTVTNSAGFSSATNFMVVKSDMTLALTSVDGDLWLPTVSVSGVISATNAPVWVNGVQGTNNGDGTWHADNVPVSPGGMASFDLSTLPPGSPDPASSTNLVKEDKMILQSAKWDNYDYMVSGTVLNEGERHRVKGSFTWGQGGTIHDVLEAVNTNQEVYYTAMTDMILSSNGTSIVSSHFTDSDGADRTSTNGSPYTIASEIGAMSWQSTNGLSQGWDKDSDVKFMFHTGGFGVAGNEVLIEATGAADELYPVSTNVPPVEITADQVGQLDTNAVAYDKIKDGASVAVTSKTGRPLYGTYPGAGAYRLTSWALHPAYSNTNRTRTTIGVGEEISLSELPARTKWNTSSGGLSTTNGSSTLLTAPSNSATAVVTATVRNTTLTKSFNVVEPSGLNAKIIATNHFPVGTVGAGMTDLLRIQPTSVSFYRIILVEQSGSVSTRTGYFADNTNVTFNVIVGSAQPSDDNSFTDNTAVGPFSYLPQPWYYGSFDDPVPVYWQVSGSSTSNYFGTFTSTTCLLNSNGDMSRSKFGITITRSTNDVSH